MDSSDGKTVVGLGSDDKRSVCEASGGYSSTNPSCRLWVAQLLKQDSESRLQQYVPLSEWHR